MSLNPYIMAPKRIAYVQVVGKLWMSNKKFTCVYNLDDEALEKINIFTRVNVEKWLNSNSGDFSSIIDFTAECGPIKIDWDSRNDPGFL